MKRGETRLLSAYYNVLITFLTFPTLSGAKFPRLKLLVRETSSGSVRDLKKSRNFFEAFESTNLESRIWKFVRSPNCEERNILGLVI